MPLTAGCTRVGAAWHVWAQLLGWAGLGTCICRLCIHRTLHLPHIFAPSPPPPCASAAWALQRLEGAVPAELQPAAAGLRTLVLPANQLSSLADLAWSLSQHPRTRFAVMANGMEACGSVGDVAAMLSGGRAVLY